jgi:hypothetical protein
MPDALQIDATGLEAREKPESLRVDSERVNGGKYVVLVTSAWGCRFLILPV